MGEVAQTLVFDIRLDQIARLAGVMAFVALGQFGFDKLARVPYDLLKSRVNLHAGGRA